LPRDVSVFLIALGRTDVLLAASDFYAAASSADFLMEEDPRTGRPLLVVKGKAHEFVYLEPLFNRLFSPQEPCEAEATAAFLAAGPGGRRAFVIGRPFEMLSLPLRDFRLFPRGLRARLAARGLAALRFEGGSRLQVLVNPGLLGPSLAEGGAPSTSS
jgi:hypothetical protein